MFVDGQIVMTSVRQVLIGDDDDVDADHCSKLKFLFLSFVICSRYCLGSSSVEPGTDMEDGCAFPLNKGLAGPRPFTTLTSVKYVLEDLGCIQLCGKHPWTTYILVLRCKILDSCEKIRTFPRRNLD